MTEPTPEQIAAIAPIVDTIIERMIDNAGALTTQYLAQQLNVVRDRLDKREMWEAQVKEWKDTEAMPSFALLRDQIKELRREVDKLRGDSNEKI